MITITRTDSSNPDFILLVRSLDAELAIRDGVEHAFYAQFNKIDNIRHAVVAYSNGTPAGCGAIKAFASDAMEIKRMFVLTEHRKSGVATEILGELERWAKELSFSRCVLETGKRQPEAIGLYVKCGYHRIPNYGQYEGMENSLCFEKVLPA